MTQIREALVNRMWRGQDPFRNFPARLYRQDQQGWGSQHPYLTDAIETLRPSVVVEVGVWKGGSVISLASTMKALELFAREVMPALRDAVPAAGFRYEAA